MTKIKHYRQHSGNLSEKKKNAFQCYAMIFVQIIGFCTVSLYPILWTFRWSLFSYNGIPSQTRFVGVQNFMNLFLKDPSYWKSWFMTIEFTVVKVCLELPLALFLAILLSRKSLRFKGLYRGLYYVPNVMSAAIIGLVFSGMFDSRGIINAWLQSAGFIENISEISWFGKRGTSFAVLLIGSIWNSFGLNVIYFISALTNVPEELYESASLDGANKWKSFLHVTLPCIAPIAQTVIMLSIIGTLGINDFIIMLTGGAPGGQTHSVMSYMTKQFTPGFFESSLPDIGYGSAASVITALIFAGISIAYNKVSSKMKKVNG